MKDYTELKNKDTEFITRENVYNDKIKNLNEQAQFEQKEIQKEMKNADEEFDKFLPKKKVLKFEDFSIDWNEDYYIDTNGRIDFYLVFTNKAIEIVDNYRAKLGFTDKASSTNNEVYYDAYLVYHLVDDTTKVEVIVKNSEKDSYAQYDFDIKISDTDLKKILARILLMQI